MLYAFSGLVQLNIVALPILIASGLVESAVLMLAHLWLLSAVGLYARHVYLDATGRLKVHIDPDRKAKPRKSKLKLVKADKEARPASDTTKLSPSAKPTSSPSLTSVKPAVTITRSTLTAPDDDEDDEDESDGGMSKSERRRLKKLARREQRRAA
jgi:hypothetical protein